MNEIIPNLFLGDRDDAANLGEFVPEEWRVIAVTEYINEIPWEPKGAEIITFMIFEKERRPLYLNLISKKIDGYLKDNKKVLLHCVHGHERSPLAMAWYLVQSGHSKDLNEAYDYIISKHPTAVRRLYWLPQNARPYPYNGEVFVK